MPNRRAVASWQSRRLPAAVRTQITGDSVTTTNAGQYWYDHLSRRREPDLTTGLMYYRAGYYNPGVGRFASVDPLGPAGGINTYAYADNDPVSNTDPTGLVPESTVNRGLQGITPT